MNKLAILAMLSMTTAAMANRYSYVTDNSGRMTTIENCGNGQFNVMPSDGSSRSIEPAVIVIPEVRGVCLPEVGRGGIEPLEGIQPIEPIGLR